jgi:hypothetical protein
VKTVTVVRALNGFVWTLKLSAFFRVYLKGSNVQVDYRNPHKRTSLLVYS